MIWEQTVRSVFIARHNAMQTMYKQRCTIEYSTATVSSYGPHSNITLLKFRIISTIKQETEIRWKTNN
jgi:hypothetical protein